MIRQNFEKFFGLIDFKLIPPFLILLFEIFILEYEFDKATEKLYAYRCGRSSQEFNYTLIKSQDIVEVYDKYKMIENFNIKYTETEDRHLVKYLINRILYTEDNFNIKCQKCLLMVYSGNILADEVYILKKEPKKIKDLLDSEMIDNYEPIDAKTLKMLIYLLIHGYLEDQTVYVYRRLLVILCRDGSIDYFIVNLSSLLDIKIPLERNKYLGHIKGSSFMIGYYTNKEKAMKLYDPEKFKNQFSEFLNYGVSKDIQKLIRKRKYLQILDLIPEEEIAKTFKLIESEKILEKIRENVNFND